MTPEGAFTLEQLNDMARKSGEEIPYYLVHDGKILNYTMTPMTPTYRIWREGNLYKFLNYWHAHAYLLQKNAEKAEAKNG